MITGPEEGAAAGYGRLRASHADREHVIDALKTAFADGRLDRDELDARVGQALTARTYAELATVTVPAPAPPHRPARPPVNRQAVKWGLAATGAMIPPAMFITAGFGAWVSLALLAMPLLFIELIVVLLFVTITLARQRADRSRTSSGQLPPPQQHARAAEPGRGSAGPKPSPRGTRTEQARTEQARTEQARTEQARTDCRSARLVPGAAWAASTSP